MIKIISTAKICSNLNLKLTPRQLSKMPDYYYLDVSKRKKNITKKSNEKNNSQSLGTFRYKLYINIDCVHQFAFIET